MESCAGILVWAYKVITISRQAHVARPRRLEGGQNFRGGTITVTGKCTQLTIAINFKSEIYKTMLRATIRQFFGLYPTDLSPSSSVMCYRLHLPPAAVPEICCAHFFLQISFTRVIGHPLSLYPCEYIRRKWSKKKYCQINLLGKKAVSGAVTLCPFLAACPALCNIRRHITTEGASWWHRFMQCQRFRKLMASTYRNCQL